MGFLKSILKALLPKQPKRTAGPTAAQRQEYARLARVNKQLDRLNAAIDQERAKSKRSIDHLCEAAKAKDRALKAIKEKRFDDAWSLLHKQKTHFLNHAAACHFTPAQTLALDASVHENLANVLRLEKRNDEAMVHILYCASADRTTKSIENKLIAYFNRAGFHATDLTELHAFVSQIKINSDFRIIQEKVQEWRSRSPAL